MADPDPLVRGSVIWALGEIGAPAKDAVPVLAAVLPDPDAWIRQRAVWALGRIGANAGPAVPALIATLSDSVERIRETAAWALGMIGAPAVAAVPALISTLTDLDERVRAEAAWALGEIGAETAVPILIRALADSAEAVRRHAADALGQIGVRSIPDLVATLADPDESVRRQTPEILGKIGGPAVPALLAAMADRDETVRQNAAASLGNIGPAAEDAIPVLVAALADPGETVRRNAGTALGKIGDAAVPALHKARSNPDPMVALAAIQILAQLAPSLLAADGKGQRPKGIERMGDVALERIGQLEVFYWIGALCRKRRTDWFSFTDLEAVLPGLVTISDSLSPASIRRHVTEVSNFFHAYYKKYDGIDVPADDDRMVADDEKFVTRFTGARRQVIGAVGWKAWEETKRYLTARGIRLKPIPRKY
jgi:HEAT repeat protein